ncbi:MAG: alpha/beta fold hydrolase, partial [Cyclobacteriaceae bacterium]
EYANRNVTNVKKMILTGSSGLFENTMGGSFPKRGSYQFVEEKVGYTFYDPKTATKELVDYVYDIVNNTQKCLRIIYIARSAQKHNMSDDLKKLKVPTLLVWGLNDTITPPMVGHEFNKLLPESELRFIDKCGHAPMMEHPEIFNELCIPFLIK